MGNQQSISEEETEPKYNYHEKVLKEAQNEVLLNQSSLNPDDEPYFSADEGDSVISLTPPRTRPESSSGEDFSDAESVEEEARNLVDRSQIESQVLVSADNFKKRKANDSGKLETKKKCGQCNVSSFQEHDSIGPELEMAKRRGASILLSPNNAQLSESVLSDTNVDNLSQEQPCNDTANTSIEPSPFKPISPKVAEISHTKRKAPQNEDDNTTPVKKMATRASSKRNRLGYFESSESEESEEEATCSGKRKNKSKNTKAKKSRGEDSLNKASKNTDSSLLGKKRHKSCHKCNDESSTDSTDSSLDNRKTKKMKRSRYRHRSCKKSKREQQSSPDNVHHEGKKGHKHKPSSDSETETTDDEMTRKRKHGNRDNSVNKSNNSLNNIVIPEDDSITHTLNQQHSNLQTCETLKMGGNSFRNLQGKVFPIRQGNLINITSVSSSGKNLAVNKIKANNQDLKVGSVSSAFVLTSSKPADASTNQTPLQARPTPSEEIVSPFQNVVLTPTRVQIPLENGFKPSMDSITDHNSDMEVEITHASELPSPTSRIFSKGKRRAQTTAKVFKHFWDEKTTNLKSFISKSITSLNSIGDSSGASWASNSPTSPAGVSIYSPANTSVPCVNSAMTSSPNIHLLSSGQMALSQLSPINAVSLQYPGVNTSTVSPVSTCQQQAHIPPSTVQLLPQENPNQALNVQLSDKLRVTIALGDISQQTTGGIVNWTDGGLTHSVTQCSKVIAARAGALMRAACNDYIENKGSNLEAPDVLTTPAGGRFDRAVEAILHVVAAPWLEGDESKNISGLVEVYANCLRFADERLALESVSFPLIGEGNFPVDMCIQAFFDSILVFLAENKSTSRSINLHLVQLVMTETHITNFAADFVQSCLDHISNEGLNKALATTYRQYTGNQMSPSLNSQATDSPERNSSGRPRIKRPRL